MQVKWTEDDERLSRMIRKRIVYYDGVGDYYASLVPEDGGYTIEYRPDRFARGDDHSWRRGLLANHYITPTYLHQYTLVEYTTHRGARVLRSGAEARDRLMSRYP